jgi:hypothetical protein
LSPKAVAAAPASATVLGTSMSPRMSPKAAMSPSNTVFVRATPAGSPVAEVAMSPMNVVGSRHASAVLAPSSALWDRQTLLQARVVAKKLEQGPPGLATFAPTPMSAARNFGFQLPQPGFFNTRPVSPKSSPPQKARSHLRKTKA